MNIRSIDEGRAKRFIVHFYIVGTVGMLIPATQALFFWLIPYSLLLTAACLFYFHQARINVATIVAGSFIILGGIGIEMVGVNTGIIFGHYRYGNSLGISVLGTPLLIGVNWLFMVYATASVLSQTRLNAPLRIVGAATLMVVYDLVLEHAAPPMDMWHWQGDNIPFQNYVAWWVCGVVFQTVLHGARVDTRNPVAAHLLALQFLFLSIVALALA